MGLNLSYCLFELGNEVGSMLAETFPCFFFGIFEIFKEGMNQKGMDNCTNYMYIYVYTLFWYCVFSFYYLGQ